MPNDREHDQIWSEVSKLRERQHKVETVAQEAVLKSEKCDGLSTKVNGQEVRLVMMERDVSSVAQNAQAITLKVERISGQLASLPGKVFAIVVASVPVIYIIVAGLWWLFQKLSK